MVQKSWKPVPSPKVQGSFRIEIDLLTNDDCNMNHLVMVLAFAFASHNLHNDLLTTQSLTLTMVTSFLAIAVIIIPLKMQHVWTLLGGHPSKKY